MAFLDETGLAELWALIREKDVNIATGSYTGTDTYGSSNPCELTFDFAPKMVIMLGFVDGSGGYTPVFGHYTTLSSQRHLAVMTSNAPSEFANKYGFGYKLPTSGSTSQMGNYGRVTNGGKTFGWYAASAERQYNVVGQTYYYMTIG